MQINKFAQRFCKSTSLLKMEKLRISLSKMIIHAKYIKECVVLINANKNQEITVLFVNFNTKETVGFFEFNNAEKLLDDIPSLFQRKRIKAVILNVFEVKTTRFKYNVDFCAALRTKFDSFQIPFHFLSPFNYGLNKVLVALNADINVRESLLLININIDGYIVGELKLTRFGYDYIERSMMFDENDTFTTEVLAEKMIGDCNPVKIILFSEIPNLPIMKQMEQEVFKAMVDKIVKLEGNLDEYNPPFCIEFAKWMFDRSKIRFHSITKTSTQYCIGNFFESGKKRILLHIKSNMPLPFHPYDIVPNSYFEYFFGYYDDNLAEYVVMETFNLDPDSHGYKIILNVDVNSFPSYQTQGFILKEITGLVKRLNDQEKKLLKIPVITFFNNSSVICVHDGHEYNFLENWNGAFGEQLYISFDKKEPKFGKKAFKAYKTKPSTVIFDILTILAQNIDEVCVDAWGFTLITDEFNEVTFEFECFDGTRKTVTPDFLLGLLIKEHIKAIEHELGNSPPAICFNILDSKGKEFLIESIEEACKALKVDCSFYEQN